MRRMNRQASPKENELTKRMSTKSVHASCKHASIIKQLMKMNIVSTKFICKHASIIKQLIKMNVVSTKFACKHASIIMNQATDHDHER